MTSTKATALQCQSGNNSQLSLFEPRTLQGVALTKYEKVKVVSQRISELEANARPHMTQLPHETLFDLANKELNHGLLTHISVARGEDMVTISELLH